MHFKSTCEIASLLKDKIGSTQILADHIIIIIINRDVRV